MIQEKLADEKITREELGRWLFGAADILRGAVRPEGYGRYILPLLFFKRLSDVHLEARERWKTHRMCRMRNVRR